MRYLQKIARGALLAGLGLAMTGCENRGYSNDGKVSCKYWGADNKGITYFDPTRNEIFIASDGKLWTYQKADITGPDIDFAEPDGRLRNIGEHTQFRPVLIAGSPEAAPYENRLEELKSMCEPGIDKTL